MKIIEQELNIINQKINTDFFDPLPEKSLKKFLSSGSKFIRSSITLLYLKAHNCNISDEIYETLAIGEIIHNASLLHDDVIDNAETRRNKKTLAKIHNPKVSILAGDYLLSLAMEKLITLKNFNVLSSFKTCTQKMALAEINQYFLRGDLPSKDDYINICKGKTASLFSAILESCATLANISNVQAKNFGELFGIFFQIKNDLSETSSEIDKNNEIYTAKDILGIEKTNDLLDNYKEKMSALLEDMPNNIYKEGLKDLINLL